MHVRTHMRIVRTHSVRTVRTVRIVRTHSTHSVRLVRTHAYARTYAHAYARAYFFFKRTLKRNCFLPNPKEIFRETL